MKCFLSVSLLQTSPNVHVTRGPSSALMGYSAGLGWWALGIFFMHFKLPPLLHEVLPFLTHIRSISTCVPIRQLVLLTSLIGVLLLCCPASLSLYTGTFSSKEQPDIRHGVYQTSSCRTVPLKADSTQCWICHSNSKQCLCCNAQFPFAFVTYDFQTDRRFLLEWCCAQGCSTLRDFPRLVTDGDTNFTLWGTAILFSLSTVR